MSLCILTAAKIKCIFMSLRPKHHVAWVKLRIKVLHTHSDKPSLLPLLWRNANTNISVYVCVPIVAAGNTVLRAQFKGVFELFWNGETFAIVSAGEKWEKCVLVCVREEEAESRLCAHALTPAAGSCRNKVLRGDRLFHVEQRLFSSTCW